jgi:hypothetical protein
MVSREEHTALRRLVQDLRVKLEDAEARCRRANKGEDEVKERFKALQSKHEGIASEVCSCDQPSQMQFMLLYSVLFLGINFALGQ